MGEKTSFEPEQMKLIHKGRILKDAETLEKVSDGDTMHVVKSSPSAGASASLAGTNAAPAATPAATSAETPAAAPPAAPIPGAIPGMPGAFPGMPGATPGMSNDPLAAAFNDPNMMQMVMNMMGGMGGGTGGMGGGTTPGATGGGDTAATLPAFGNPLVPGATGMGAPGMGAFPGLGGLGGQLDANTMQQMLQSP